MQVNITLLAQMCNFLVAWFLLHIFYFKPAIALIDAEQRESDELLLQKGAWREYVVDKQYEIQACWRKLKQFARQHIPALTFVSHSARMQNIEASTQDKQLENPLDGMAHEKLVEELAAKIIMQVPHVKL